MKYIFYYYWSHDLRPCPAKAIEDDGETIGGKGNLTDYKWEISKKDFLADNNLMDLTKRFPWPLPEDT